MPFSSNTIKKAWELGNGRCQCARKAHAHPDGNCNHLLSWDSLRKDGYGRWETRSRSGLKEDTVDDCEILCWQCFKQIKAV